MERVVQICCSNIFVPPIYQHIPCGTIIQSGISLSFELKAKPSVKIREACGKIWGIRGIRVVLIILLDIRIGVIISISWQWRLVVVIFLGCEGIPVIGIGQLSGPPCALWSIKRASSFTKRAPLVTVTRGIRVSGQGSIWSKAPVETGSECAINKGRGGSEKITSSPADLVTSDGGLVMS